MVRAEKSGRRRWSKAIGPQRPRETNIWSSANARLPSSEGRSKLYLRGERAKLWREATMSAENFESDDLGIPGFLDRRDEVPRHVCAQCGREPDGLEEPLRHGDKLFWLHPVCRPFWFRENPGRDLGSEKRPEPVELIKYDRACRAIAEAKLADEVKDIRDRAIAIRAYARQAKNKTLEADAWEIRQRAERRLGEMMREQPKAPPGRPIETGEYSTKEIGLSENPISYASAGIDKNLAHRARTLAAMPTEDFTLFVDEGREQVQRSVERAVSSNDDDPGEPPAYAKRLSEDQARIIGQVVKMFDEDLEQDGRKELMRVLTAKYRERMTEATA
jgi:hypothetical protein